MGAALSRPDPGNRAQSRQPGNGHGTQRRPPSWAWVALAGVLLAACGGGATPKTTATTGNTATTTATSAPSSGSPAPSPTVWLCRPGLDNDPCTADQTATVVTASGSTRRQPAPVAAEPAFDCFYVYGTVSSENALNADQKIQPAEVQVAEAQASRFSSVCRVWAPIYRQVTLQALSSGRAVDPSVIAIAYESLAQAWQDYLTHDNDGRPVIFIGHSQGAAMLITLLRHQVDNNPPLRRRLISAIVLGGNVAVPAGQRVGGTFAHIPACQSPAETGCVIAYSTFLTPPPPDSLFGIPGQGVSLQSDQTAKAGLQVVCVNPGAIGSSGRAQLDPYFPVLPADRRPATPTPWVTYPDLYTGGCATGGGASWLQVDVTPTPGDTRPRVSEDLGPLWGLHVYDVNLALGNLVNDVHLEEAAFSGR